MPWLRELFRPSPLLGLEIKRLNRLRLAGSFALIPVLLLLAIFSAHGEGSALWTRALGLVLLTYGVGLRFWALGAIDGRKKRILVTWGAYHRVRHPLYLGSFLILLSFCVLSGSWSATALAGLLFLALYLPVIGAEERLLAAQYGPGWTSYCAHSGAFLPRFGGPSEGPELPFELRRPAREIGVLVLIFLGVVGASELLRQLRQLADPPHWFF